MERSGIAIAGSILADRINEINAYPKEGELTKIVSQSRAVGGCVPNVAIDIKRVDGSIDVYALGRIGCDSDGSFILDTLRENKVDTSLINTGSLPTSFTDVMSVKGGQRTFFTYPGECANFGIDDIDFEKLCAKMLHLGYFLLLDKVDAGEGRLILKKAKEEGIKTSIDLVSETGDRYSVVKDCLEYTDNLIINELEAGMIAGIEPKAENLEEIARRIKALGVAQRVIIHTPGIGICLSDNGYFTLPSYDLPKGFIKGTTGAGDAFCAGALIGIYRELGELEILALASKCAVASLTSPDSISGLCCEDKIDELCSSLERKII